MTRNITVWALAGLVAFAAAALAIAGPNDKKAAASMERSGFNKFKALAGEWLDADAKGEDAKKVAVRYRVMSAGSIVVEEIFPASEHDMLTVYHMDGDKLVMTHYCAMGNQPRMQAAPMSESNRIKFDFTGGCNIRPDKDAHMHSAVFTFTDADHLQAEWTSWKDGKPQEPHTFHFVRRK